MYSLHPELAVNRRCCPLSSSPHCMLRFACFADRNRLSVVCESSLSALSIPSTLQRRITSPATSLMRRLLIEHPFSPLRRSVRHTSECDARHLEPAVSQSHVGHAGVDIQLHSGITRRRSSRRHGGEGSQAATEGERQRKDAGKQKQHTGMRVRDRFQMRGEVEEWRAHEVVPRSESEQRVMQTESRE